MKWKLSSFTFTLDFYRGNPWISVDTARKAFMNFHSIYAISVPPGPFSVPVSRFHGDRGSRSEGRLGKSHRIISRNRTASMKLSLPVSRHETTLSLFLQRVSCPRRSWDKRKTGGKQGKARQIRKRRKEFEKFLPWFCRRWESLTCRETLENTSAEPLAKILPPFSVLFRAEWQGNQMAGKKRSLGAF